MREYTKATLTGMLAPLCWGTTVGLVRTITEQFGLSAGLTFLYAFIVIMLLGVLGVPKPGQFPKKIFIVRAALGKLVLHIVLRFNVYVPKRKANG